MLEFRYERMNDIFEKWHIIGLPFPAVLHRFSGVEDFPPHSHPWPFISFVLFGGYIEDVYDAQRGFTATNHRQVGDGFRIEASHIHRIIALPHDVCWTLILPQPGETQKPGFYEFRDEATYFRFWDEPEFRRLS